MRFITEGPVSPDSKMFVGRTNEIAQLREWLRELSCFATILGARQTGKTSLLLKLRGSLGENEAPVFINLQAVGDSDISHCYAYIAEEIRQQIPGAESVELHRSALGDAAFLAFLRHVARAAVSSRFVVMVDEIGALSELTANKLAQTIRSIFTDRFVKEEFQRYFFVLAGGTDMLRLATSRNSPLANVTQSIYLPDFTRDQVEQLFRGGLSEMLSDRVGEVSGAVYDWTGGFPYWTQLLGAHVEGAQAEMKTDEIHDLIERLLQIEDRNLPHVCKLVDASEGRVSDVLLSILHDEPIPFARTNATIARLELIGVVKNDNGLCRIRNKIYSQLLIRHLRPANQRWGGEYSDYKRHGKLDIPRTASRTVNLLHLSDLHFGTASDAHVYRTHLAMDVKRELQVNVIDYMILSGDIADHSLEDEYRAAAEFTMSLAAQFSITKDRIIFTPGNHDVNWELSQQAYGFVPSFKLPDTLAAGRHIPANPVGALIRNDEQYTRRFEQFDRFVRSIGTGVGYPSDYIDQGVLFKDSSDRILFLSLNSCWELDHYFTTRASINPEALTRVLDSISSAEYDDWLKIAVWHHPVSGDQAMPDDFLEVLAVHGFVIGMHGHIHRAIDPQYIYDERRHIHIIGAGTFGAPSRQQVVGIPLQYNLITINCERRLATVHSRKKETRYGSWSADARWGDKNNPKAHYDIDLNERWGKSRSASQGHNG